MALFGFDQCRPSCYFNVSVHLRSCTESQILKLRGPFREQLAEPPTSRRHIVIYSMVKKEVVGSCVSCALTKLTQPVRGRTRSITHLLDVRLLL